MDYKTADTLVELRKKNGYSQEELADKLGVSRQAVSKWERAESLPDTENLIALARLYNVTLDEVINGEKPKKPDDAIKDNQNIFTFSIDRKKAMNIIKFVALGLGIVFVSVGIGFFLGFAVPETRDLKLAQNESITPIDAEVTDYERTGVVMGNEAMCKIVFEWSGKSGTSNAVYSYPEAEAMIGKTVLIRVDGDRAVMVDYQRSALSIIGFVFIGGFGGIGILFIGAFVIIFVRGKRKPNKA